MQTTNLIPGYGAKAVFGDSAELLIPFAARCKMIVEHSQHERPVDFLERLSQLVEVSEEVWAAPRKLVQSKWESPGRVSPGGTHAKAKERRRGRAITP